MKIGLVIFTRNEKENSKLFYPKIPFKLVNCVYVVDGNSTDGTKEFFKEKKIKVFGQIYPGVGGAYEAAFRNTKENALIFIHPDGNMNSRDVRKFVKFLKEGSEFIIATRMTGGGYNEEDRQLFKPRKWFTQFLAIAANIVWGDSQNYSTDVVQGYRAISRDVYKKLGTKIPNAVAPDYEQVIRALKKKIKITEFPTTEGERVYGDTSMTSFKTGRENIKVFIRELFS